MSAVKMAALGYGPFIPIIPPGAKLVPGSKVPLKARGKIPGICLGEDLWDSLRGWNRRRFTPEEVDAMKGNIGMPLHEFIAMDIDVLNEALSNLLEEITHRRLGVVPARIGQWPKRALVYRLRGQPIHRMQLHITSPDKTKSQVELLGTGQQIVMEGIHATTLEPYHLTGALPPVKDLPGVDLEKAIALFAEMEEALTGTGHGCSRSRSGSGAPKGTIDQESLTGPVERIREAMEYIPNDDTRYPDRSDCIRMLAALHAATIHYPEEGWEIALKWALKWEKNTEEWVRKEWDSFHGTKHDIGAEWVYDEAKHFGYSTAAYDFGPVAKETSLIVAAPAPVVKGGTSSSEHSHLWLRDQLIEVYGGDLRWVSSKKQWFECSDEFWVPSECGVYVRTEAICNAAARTILADMTTEAAAASARRLCDGRTINTVVKLAQTTPAFQAHPDVFDANPDLLGIPGGVVDLRTGTFLEPDREYFITQSTGIVPSFEPAPIWERFLWETTGGDEEYIRYLQRLAGYWLTGHTREHCLVFVWGGGGNGKSTFLNVIRATGGSYCLVASMDTFVATKDPIHPVGIAVLAGSRLVLVPETRVGQRLNDGLIKSLTAGDPVTARVMYGNPVTTTPGYKLAFSGNHQPKLIDVDEATRRRYQVLPFTRQPKVIDKLLPERLRAEYAAILGWRIRGAQQWYNTGLRPPKQVQVATSDYMEREDLMGQWLDECCQIQGPEWRALASRLYENWEFWCGQHTVSPGSTVSFSRRLQERGFRQNRQKEGIFYEGLVLKGDKKP